MSNIISPSILSADFADLKADIARVGRAPWLHIDVMDGHFVPNISIGLPVVRSLRRATDRFLDVHLMISEPLAYVERFAEAGSDLICFHIEAGEGKLDPGEVIRRIKACGKQAAIALKPLTSASCLRPWLPLLDMVLVMTVEPGFGGQAFRPDMLPKIREVRKMAAECGSTLKIQVDGGIDAETARLCREAGASVLVAGSYVFGSADPDAAVACLERA